MAFVSDSEASDGELRILLVGKTGVGKSSTGNSLLGKDIFETSLSMTSVTKETQYGEAVRFGRRLTVVDTPGFYDTKQSNKDIVREIVRIFGFLSAGIHVLLYVIGVERFTNECIQTKDLVLRTFGEDIRKRIIIVITHYDSLQAERINLQKFLASSGKEFIQFQNMCNNRVFFINNNAQCDVLSEQVKALMNMTDIVMNDNHGECFTNYHLKIVRAFLRLERKRKKINLSRARIVLFNRAAVNLGLQKVLVWDQERNKPVTIRVSKGSSQFVLPVKPVVPPPLLCQPNERRNIISNKIKPISIKRKTYGPDKDSKEVSAETVQSLTVPGTRNTDDIKKSEKKETDKPNQQCEAVADRDGVESNQLPESVIDRKTRLITKDIEAQSLTVPGTRNTDDIKRSEKNEISKTNQQCEAAADRDGVESNQLPESVIDRETWLTIEDIEDEHEMGSEDVDCLEDKSSDRQKVQDNSFFDILADFFVALFSPLVNNNSM